MSGIGQDSLPGLVLFLVYVNDFPSLFESPCLIFTLDVKLWSTVQSPVDDEILQYDLKKLDRWA